MKSTFRNNIPETRRTGCLCNGVELWIATVISGTCVAAHERQRSDLDDECFYGVALFDFAHVNGGLAAFLFVHITRRCPRR